MSLLRPRIFIICCVVTRLSSLEPRLSLPSGGGCARRISATLRPAWRQRYLKKLRVSTCCREVAIGKRSARRGSGPCGKQMRAVALEPRRLNTEYFGVLPASSYPCFPPARARRPWRVADGCARDRCRDPCIRNEVNSETQAGWRLHARGQKFPDPWARLELTLRTGSCCRYRPRG